jgi:transcriptional regulator with XRE-family HTH domain
MNTLYKEIGQRIKRQRENKNLSQEELAIKIGLTRTSITNLEAGRQNISLKTLLNISDALNIDARNFLPVRNTKIIMNIKRLGLFKCEKDKRFFELCEIHSLIIDRTEEIILEWREIKYNSNAYDLIMQSINAMKTIQEFTVLK